MPDSALTPGTEIPNLGRVLVTGGAGFIGCAISQRLAPFATQWVVVDNMHPQVHPSNERPAALAAEAELRIGDVTDSGMWDELFLAFRPDIVIHLAAETGTAQSLHSATRHAAVNVVGTTTLLDALGRAGHVPSRFLLSSSRAVYGEGRWLKADGTVCHPGMRTHDQLASGEWDFSGLVPLVSSATTSPPHPTSVYGATKLAQEHIVSAWAGAVGCHLTILRLQNVYGAGQSLSNPYTGIVSLFSQLAMAGESIPIYEDGAITRDFVYIDDVADAFTAALVGLGPDDGSGSEVFDIGSGVGTKILEIATVISNYHSAPEPHINGLFRDGDVRFAACSIDDTTARLPWRPRVSITDGVSQLQDWIAQQRTHVQ